jgi:hypothetical protein
VIANVPAVVTVTRCRRVIRLPTLLGPFWLLSPRPAQPHSVLEIWRDEYRYLRAAPWRSHRVPEGFQQIVNRREIGILRSGRGKGLGLPRLPSDRRSVSRAFWTTGALPKTPVFRGHLDNLIFSSHFYKTAARRRSAAFMPILDNPKHELFAQAIAKGQSASEAYVLAGYAKDDGNASRLTGNDKVAARVKELLEDATAVAGVTAARVIAELARTGQRDPSGSLDGALGGRACPAGSSEPLCMGRGPR